MSIHWIYHSARLELALNCIHPLDTWVLGGAAATKLIQQKAFLAQCAHLKVPICLYKDCADFHLNLPHNWIVWSDEQFIEAIALNSGGLIQW